MTEKGEQAGAVLAISATPRTFAHEFNAQLTDVAHDRTISAQFDLDRDRLAQLFAGNDPRQYGAYLFDQVFRQSEDEATKKRGQLALRLEELLRQADHLDGGDLRLKIEVDSLLLPLLQGVAWEYLFHETDGIALGADLRACLFRDVAVDADRRSAVKGIPRVLVAVVSPSESSFQQFNHQFKMDLKPIDVAAENTRLGFLFESLRPKLVYTVLEEAEPGVGKLDQIVAAVRDGEFHVLHLLCHGVVLNNKAYLLLADADGGVHLVDEEAFAAELADMGSHLRLVVLDACQTAQYSQADSFSGVVARLIKVVPAVIGMQRTWYTGIAGDKFTRNFYEELCKRGVVDRAVQRARHDLRRWKQDRWEWGTPVLYLRLGDGQLFQVKPPKQATGADDEGATGADDEGATGADTEATPGKEASARPQNTGRQGGTGAYFGPGTVLSDVTIDADAAGGNIVEGGNIPVDAPESGKGLVFEGTQLTNTTIRGHFAGGGIYRQALAEQAAASFGPEKQAAAQRALVEYYQARLADLEDRRAEAPEALTHLAAEIADLQAEIQALQLGAQRGDG